MQAYYEKAVREDETPDTIVLSVLAIDRDEPGTNNSAVRYSLGTGAFCASFLMFIIIPS